MMKTFWLVLIGFLFLLTSCGGGRPTIVSPADGSRIQIGNTGGNQTGFGAPVITVRVQDDDTEVSITFTPANPPGLLCQPGQGIAYCYRNTQGGGFVNGDTGLVIRAQKGDERDAIGVVLTNGFQQTAN